ncbi:MAG: hypothetical protein ACRC1K_11035, partial [Planctomycetia bacterium]
NSVLQNMGVSFMLELYYQKWLISLLDQLNQQGVLIGFVDPESKEDNWSVRTETFGRNILIKPRKSD